MGAWFVAPVSAHALPKEYEVKAAFLYNFAQFVEWPASSMPAGSPFKLCVLGNDPFGKTIDSVLQGETVRARPIEILRIDDTETVGQCNMLFVGSSYSNQLDQLLEQVKHRPILTVSDMGDFAFNGGIIHFVPQQRKIRFIINPEAAQKAGLKISSQLLKLAIIQE